MEAFGTIRSITLGIKAKNGGKVENWLFFLIVLIQKKKQSLFVTNGKKVTKKRKCVCCCPHAAHFRGLRLAYNLRIAQNPMSWRLGFHCELGQAVTGRQKGAKAYLASPYPCARQARSNWLGSALCGRLLEKAEQETTKKEEA